MPIDPTIFLRGYQGPVNPTQILAHAQQLKNAGLETQLRQQQLQSGQLSLNEQMDAIAKKKAIESAAQGAFQTPAPVTTQQPAVNVGGVSIPGGQSTVQGPAQLNRGMLLSNVGKVDPMAAVGMQQQFSQQDAANQKAQLDIREQLTKINGEQLDQTAKTLGMTTQILGAVKAVPPEARPQAYAQAVGQLQNMGLVPANHPTDYPGDQVLDMELHQGMTAQQQVAEETARRTATETNRHNVATEGKAVDTLAETIRHNKVDEANKAAEVQGSAGLLTPEAKKKLSTMFATTGQLPSLGMGKAGANMRADIMNQAASDYPNIDFATNAAAYKANKDSLTNVTKTLDTLTAFEGTAVKNLKQFTDLADKIPDTGIPWLNTPVRNLSRNVVGSENMAAVEAARTVALREIARVTNDPKLSGVLSDDARREVLGLNPSNATIPQIKAVSKILINDMKNVHESLGAQKEAISTRIGINPAVMNQPQGDGTSDPFAAYGGKKVK